MSVAREARLPVDEHLSLCETLDRVLNKGVVLVGEVVISVAEVDLIFIGLHLILTSLETARGGESTLLRDGERTP